MVDNEIEFINYLINEIFPISIKSHEPTWYLERYNDLILFYKTHEVSRIEESTELHHVLPRCLGGSDESDNLVRLPIKSHILAHVLLYLGNPKSVGLSLAVLMMMPMNFHNTPGSYNTQEKRFSIISKNFNLEEISGLREQAKKSLIGRSGVSHSDEFKTSLSKRMSGENNPMFGRHGDSHPSFGKPVSDVTKKKISDSLVGRHLSEETKKKISGAMKNVGVGRKLSESTKEKISKNHANCSLGNNSQSKQVRNLITGDIYSSAKEAFIASNLKITYGRFIQLLNNNGYSRKNHKEFNWRWN